ncbi:hypothetical protein KIN20_011809 [Parelaphostrongylus tenuis]|uniref:Uncharacterized protein n=1 Tax=Parelaphostrongylus tenuis TaxID=148309 RepID=A0AAD5MDI3_PARTN|nr:hypothetical protein KIN20_011809 [Parelaphostrongylus tenuis]
MHASFNKSTYRKMAWKMLRKIAAAGATAEVLEDLAEEEYKKVNRMRELLGSAKWVVITECVHKATQMVYDLREQVVLQRFEDPRQNGPSDEGGTQLPPTSTASSIADHHPYGRLRSPGPPHLKS